MRSKTPKSDAAVVIATKGGGTNNHTIKCRVHLRSINAMLLVSKVLIDTTVRWQGRRLGGRAEG